MFTTTRRLSFGDCDPSGIAYFPAYLNLLVGVVEEFFLHVGLPWPDLINKRGMGMPTTSLDIDFLSPGRHGDLMQFTLEVKRIGTSSLELEHKVEVDTRLVWTARQRLVCVAHDTPKAQAWPEDVRAILTRFLQQEPVSNREPG